MTEQIVDVNPNADEIASLEAQIAQIDVTKLDPLDNGKVKQDPQIVETKQPETQVESTEVTEDPIKTELDRVKGQTQGKSPKEKFEYKLQREIAQAKEMGIDIAQIAGIKPLEEVEDGEKPLTRKDLDSILQTVKPQSKKAIEMALEIENEAERELHLHYLEHKISPNLTEEEKFQTAKDMVQGVKLKNQINLGNIKPQANSHSSASSFVPNKQANFDNHKLTPEEELFFNDAKARGVALSKEEIIKMRK
jgi:hypothetical protein